jgi:hypothetical protein
MVLSKMPFRPSLEPVEGVLMPAATSPRGPEPRGRRTLIATALLASATGLFALASAVSGTPAVDDAMTDGGSADAPLDPKGLQFFESRIRPVLIEHCYGCHSAESGKTKADLRVDTRDGLLRGGIGGPAIVPGSPDDSLLLRALRYDDEDLQMPPKARLPDAVVRDVETWIAMGAPDPRGAAIGHGTIDGAGPALSSYGVDLEKGRAFWAFRPPIRALAPSIPADAPKDVAKLADWPLGDIDRFVLAAMLETGTRPVEDADRRTWLRRVSFDLTGLPPTPAEIAAFEKDRSPEAHARVVDRLLASNAFGERWGRHWLDVARYAESSGKESNILYPHAWRYRDYVLDSFNDDKPFDQFIREQIAGDLLPAETPTQRAEQLVATGYLAIGPKSHTAQNGRQFQADLVDEQIDAMSQGILGITISCARCHDHKFDPIPQRDYYAMAGIFASTRTAFGTERGAGNRRTAVLIELPEAADVPDGPTMSRERRALIAAAEERIRAELERAADGPRDGAANIARIRTQRDQSTILATILDRFDESGRPTSRNRLAMGVLDAERPIDVPLLVRGEIDQPGEVVRRGFLQVLDGVDAPAISGGSGRRELAEWLVAPTNPLTARVWANRVWLHLFGKGIVPTPDNFGFGGLPPTNQPLLDHLALRLIEHGWSTKALVREIVLSRSYRLAATGDSRNEAVDPENRTLWRQPARRLDAEAIRDAMLAVSGRLEAAPVGSPVNFAEGAMRGQERRLVDLDADRPVRSVHLPIVRDQVPAALDVFDFADPSFVVGDRAETNVATQALFLMNAPEVMASADAFADRLMSAEADDRGRIEAAFELAYGRRPSAIEIDAARDFLRDVEKALASDSADGGRADSAPARRLRDRVRNGAAAESRRASDVRRASWSAFCQAIFQSGEFRTLH